jgi:hypothetical protein
MANQTLLILLVIAGVAAFFYFGCKVTCTKTEGFQRQCLGGTCSGMQRSPVDYAEKNPSGWQQNPHYEALPSVRFQPLDYGPVDFYSDLRKLGDGEMFHQYAQDYEGVGTQIDHMQNDSKNRFDLRDIGDYQFAAQMDGLYNPKFGPQGIRNTEIDYNEPNPFFDKLYGGASWLHYGKLI